MTDLTDKWKKGELPSADENHTWLAYYLKQASGRIHADSYWRGNWGHADRNSIIEVLAPVPSYEEWQEAYNCMLENEVLRLKNAQLKELLMECLAHLTIGKYCTSVTPINILCDEVEEALK